MTITAIRLREPNAQKGWEMRSYTSVRGTRYKAGNDSAPSALRVTTSAEEIAEVRAASPQFEVLTFATTEALNEFVQREMEERVRLGAAAVRAKVEQVERAQEAAAVAAKPVEALYERLPTPQPQVKPTAAPPAPAPVVAPSTSAADEPEARKGRGRPRRG